MSRTKLVAGNWKMNGSASANQALVDGLLQGLAAQPSKAEVLVCPPFPYLAQVQKALNGSVVVLGAQNLAVSTAAGAFTGEVQGAMLKELDCRYVIVGHSERRAFYGETNAVVAQKAQAALAQDLVPILCVGETLDQRESGNTEAVIAAQLDAVLAVLPAQDWRDTVVAYEPVWAIGTGKTASPEQAQAVHAFIRARIAAHSATLANSLRILYGGSVKPDNAQAIFGQADVDGGLIGGAALKASDFLAICAAA